MMNGACSTHVRDLNCEIGKRGPIDVTGGGVAKVKGQMLVQYFWGHGVEEGQIEE